MSTPNLSIQVEPNVGGKAAYLPVAASASDQPAIVKIVLRLRIMNNESSTVMVNGIQFSYPGSAAPSQNMQGVGLVLIVDGAKTPSANIGAGQTATWSSGAVDLDPDPKKTNNINNAVYLPAPAPAKVKVSVSCANFTTAASVTLDLTPYAAPAEGGAYYFRSVRAICATANLPSRRRSIGRTAVQPAIRSSRTIFRSRRWITGRGVPFCPVAPR